MSDTGDKFKSAFNVFKQKAGETFQQGKNQVKIAEAKAKVARVEYDIGKYVYELYEQGMHEASFDDQTLLSKLENVQQLKEEIERRNEEE